MFTWPWWIFSIIAAILWGLHFNLVVKVSSVLPKDIYTPLTLFLITSFSIILLLPVIHQKIFTNLDWSVLVGGALIFSGAMLIVWKHG